MVPRAGLRGFEVDAKSGAGVKQFAPAVRALLADKLRAYEEKGQIGRVLRVMVLGIPNVGKSTFINKVSGRKTAKAEDRPGVTRGKQWVPVDKRWSLTRRASSGRSSRTPMWVCASGLPAPSATT